MKNVYVKKLMWYGIFFLLALFVIFFVGKQVDSDGKTHVTLKFDAIKDFRLGMDVAGGVSLTYKLDFAKYEEVYTNKTELDAFKKRAIEIVRKNIDKRISALGVSDYNAYTRTLKGQQYLIVDIGGVNSLEAAKEIIGKTVELEFKVPFEGDDAEVTAQRKQLAQTLRTEIQKDLANMGTIMEAKSLQDVIYQVYTGTTLNEMPSVYQARVASLNAMKTGALSEMWEGVYTMTAAYGEDGKPVIQTLSGFTFFKLNAKETNTLSAITPEQVINSAKENTLPYKELYETQPRGVAAGQVALQGTTLVYNSGAAFSGEEAYKMTIYAIPTPNVLGKSQEETQALQATHEATKIGLMQALQSGTVVQATGAEKVLDNEWRSQQDMQQSIPSFVGNQPGVYAFADTKATFIVHIHQRKQAQDTIYSIIAIENVPADRATQIQEAMYKETRYTLEEVFVKNTPQRKLAVDPTTNEILNGAFFKFAGVSAGSTGEPVVVINFDDSGKEIFCRISEKYVGKPIAIFIDGKLITSPTINERICGGGAQIDGDFTPAEARDLTEDLNSGALPVPLVLSHEEKVSPVLGETALRGALRAALLGFFAVIALLAIMYDKKKVLVGVGVLTVYMVYLLAVLKLPFIDYAFSLSGIAAIILALGMGIDANILIFERVREELAAGKSIQGAIDTAMERSWAPIKDGNISTGLIAALLFFLGMSVFKGFGGMIIITMTLVLTINVPLTKVLLHVLFKKK